MKPCVCGKPVRMGGERMRINRKHGVAHWVVHSADSSGVSGCVPGTWTTFMMKPYPKRDEDKDWHKMLARWEAVERAEQVPA